MGKTIKKGLTIKKKNSITGYLFIAPWLIGFFALTAFPFVYSILLSLHSVQLKTSGTVMTWKGWYYFDQALNVDKNFKLDLMNTVTFIVCAVPVILVFSLIIAMLLRGKYPLRLFFRAVFFFPVIILSGPVISQLLTKHTSDFSQSGKEIYTFLNTMPDIIKTPSLFVMDNLVLILWFSGVQILIFLAGLQKISPEIYEAASIDGAGEWEKFWKITLPYMKPMILVAAIYSIVEIANFSNNAVNTSIVAHLFEVNQPYSFSAAMSWIYFVVVIAVLLVFTLLINGVKREKRI